MRTIEAGFLKEWGDLGELEAGWKDALIDREVSKSGENLGEN